MQCKHAAVFELRHERAFEHEQHMPAAAPVVREVPGRILDHPDTRAPDLERLPERLAGHSLMLDGRHRRPVRHKKLEILEFHFTAPVLTAARTIPSAHFQSSGSAPICMAAS